LLRGLTRTLGIPMVTNYGVGPYTCRLKVVTYFNHQQAPFSGAVAGEQASLHHLIIALISLITNI
jgi:hypothetical protein